ncbi:uncharacterized protein M421DRAFT_3657 [Didymella exigua CBS 183.55]|uniref:Uncharacterized protein n=1 Tax=Didymella exigua CBS 183.55 TaxID=1150837 RepID=A0A6A5RTY8_9PLEO|nr:uncharacterized protein M421DRAFT_3657 [Didymella exigua CBS 183.55]KAF1930624.1 hypothetical protein M421DRAFT_3657 [Didymella exigua CBS 183.55]
MQSQSSLSSQLSSLSSHNPCLALGSEQDEKPLPPSFVGETDPYMTRADNDDEIEALPSLPSWCREIPAALREATTSQREEPSLKDLTDETLDTWRAREFSKMMGSGSGAQQEASSSTKFPLLIGVWYICLQEWDETSLKLREVETQVTCKAV